MRTIALWLRIAVALALPAATVAAVTDADRVQVYREFRTAFDAHEFKEALPLAERLVAITEEQYGGSDRALVNPLANLGTTHYRLADYAAAEQAYLRGIKIAEDSGGAADRLLLLPLHGLGATYFKSGQYDEASVALKRALDLSRNLDGLFNPAQMPILEPLIASLVELERHDDAEREFEYSVRVAENAYGKTDSRLMRPLDRYARWMERMGRYTTARVLHARALTIAEQVGGENSVLTVDPLTGIARTYRLEFVNGPEQGAEAGTRSPDPGLADFGARPIGGQQLNPEGEHALLLAIQAIDKNSPADLQHRGMTKVELGDWYLCAGAGPKAIQVYQSAWKDLAESGSTATFAAPRQLAYRGPVMSIARSRLNADNVEEHFVETRFTVTKDGRVADVVAVSSDASPSQQKLVVSAVKRARYAPRLENGDPVDTSDVTLRERIVVKRPKNSD